MESHNYRYAIENILAIWKRADEDAIERIRDAYAKAVAEHGEEPALSPYWIELDTAWRKAMDRMRIDSQFRVNLAASARRRGIAMREKEKEEIP